MREQLVLAHQHVVLASLCQKWGKLDENGPQAIHEFAEILSLLVK